MFSVIVAFSDALLVQPLIAGALISGELRTGTQTQSLDRIKISIYNDTKENDGCYRIKIIAHLIITKIKFLDLIYK
jgi:hypothetical protein